MTTNMNGKPITIWHNVTKNTRLLQMNIKHTATSAQIVQIYARISDFRPDSVTVNRQNIIKYSEILKF